MRWHLLTVFVMAGVALAQQTTTQQPAAANTSGMVVQGGYASTPVMAPTVLTPHVTLSSASSNPVGATSSAYGLQVGATSAAIPATTAQQSVVNQAVVSSGNTNNGNVTTGTGPAATIVAPGQNAQAGEAGKASGVSGGFIGAAGSEPDIAAASRYYRTHPMHAVRTYTNDDVQRLNGQSNTASNTGTMNMPASDVNAPAAPATSNPSATMPQADQTRGPEAPAPAQTPSEAPASKPKPYTPPATPPQQ